MNTRTASSIFTPPIVCGGIIVGLAMGMRGSLGLFLTPMTAAHGWSREGFAFALALQNLLWGMAQPLSARPRLTPADSVKPPTLAVTAIPNSPAAYSTMPPATTRVAP